MNFRQCKYCVMDNASDNTIVFDENGRCNYCKDAESRINTTTYFPGPEGQEKLEAFLKKIKAEGKGKEYDCMMGISGGLDSSYLAYLGYKWGLRILAVHIDDGFDTEISQQNIKKLVSATHMKMLTIAPDTEQFYDLTKAFMKAGVPNIATPQDNCLFAFLYDEMKRYNIKFFLTGGNFALESILQRGNTHSAYDVVNIRDIHRKFGTKPMNKLKFITSVGKELNKRINGVQTVCLLDLIDYNRDRAFAELKEFCGFEYYGSKHLENVFTAFTQLYWFPKKFGVDKRKSHLSSMIVSGQMTREQALEELKKPMYDETQMNSYIKIVKEKLGLSDGEYDTILNAKAHQHIDYKTEKLAPALFKLRNALKR